MTSSDFTIDPFCLEVDGLWMDLELQMYGKTVLRERASEVTEFDEALVELSREMLKVMYTAHGIGLAAEQVGHTKRMFVIDIPAESDVDENSLWRGCTQRCRCRWCW